MARPTDRRNKPRPASDFAALQAQCTTDAQTKTLAAVVAADGNQARAAVALGVAVSSVKGVIAKLRRRAELSALGAGEIVPPGQRLRGTSVLHDGKGKIDRRWDKTERDTDEGAHEPEEPVPPDFALTRVSTLVDGQGQVRARWLAADREKLAQHAAFAQAIRDVCAEHITPFRPQTAPVLSHEAGDWLNVFPLGDPHIGMLAHAPETGDHHDVTIGVNDLKAAIDLLVARAPIAKRAKLINLGDFFHAQDDRQVTPGHGHKLDVDGRWYKVARAGVGVMVYAIRALLCTHETVEVDNIPGNHDPDAARWLALALEIWFKDEPRVVVRDNASHFGAVTFGRNMIATAHGDGIAREKLPGLFAARFPEIWGPAQFRVCYSGHVHHERVKEFPGMTVENFRILPGKDSYHSSHGYDSGRSLDVISHHAVYGPKARARVDISEVRDYQRREGA